MLGSPNPGYFTYDGDQSTKPNARQGVPRVPEGSAGIERTLVAYLDARGKACAGHLVRRPVRLRRVHAGGHPAGGLFSGCRGEEERASRPSCGAAGRRAVRPELPQGDRHARQHRPDGAADPRSAGSHTPIGLYAQDQSGPQRSTGPRQTAPATRSPSHERRRPRPSRCSSWRLAALFVGQPPCAQPRRSGVSWRTR